MDIPLDEVVYFDAITSNPTTGAAADADSTPTFAVYEEATDTDIGVGGNMTKRTSLTGNYRGSFTMSSANGFEVGKWYAVIVSATCSSVAGKARVMHFRCSAAEAIAGKIKVDVDGWKGVSAAAVDASGYPVVTIKDGTGQGELNITSGVVDAKLAAGVAHQGNSLAITTDVAIGGEFSIDGALVVGGTFDVVGATTFTGAVTFTGAITGTNASNNLRINGVAPGAAGGLFIAGTNAATTITTALTTTFTGNLTGSVASVTGAVGSVTGNVGGNVAGSVASVTGNVGGNVVGSVASVTAAVTITGDAATWATRGLTMIELDGSVYRYTTNALEQAPAGGGGGGGTDWTADERTSIRTILGIPASGTTPEEPTAGVLDTIRDKTQLIAAGDFDVVSPVSSDGESIALFRGDDYYNADSRALSFTSTDWPSITGATVVLKLSNGVSITGTVTSATACYFELTRTQTAAIEEDALDFEIEATLSNTHVVTIVTGSVSISGQI